MITTHHAKKTPRAITICLPLIFFAASSLALAQYRFDVRTTDNGAPNNFVYAVAQTRDGYIWFTTLDGLARYDGVRITVFNTGNSPSLPSNRLTDLCEDRAGALWIGTEGDGLVKFQSKHFTVYTAKDGLPDNSIAAIHEDGAGNLLVATQQGFARRQDERFVPHVPDQPGLSRIFGYRGRSGPVWGIGQTGPNKFSDAVSMSYRALRIPPRTPVFSMREDRAGALWIGTESGLIRMQNGSPRLYTEKDGLPKNVVTVVKEDREGNLWIGGAGGLCRFKDGKFINVGLAGNYVTGFIEDREGAFWISTWGGGMIRMSKQVVTTYTDKHGLAANNVYPVFEDRAGQVWMGTWGGGLSRFRDGRFDRFTGQNSLLGPLVTALAEDSEGGLWIGSFSGVARLKDGRLTDFKDQLRLPGQVIQAILEDAAGALWFATNAGLARRRNGPAVVYTTKDGLAGDDVRAILQDRQGRLWIGTYSGVTQIAGGKLTSQFTSWTKREGMKSHRVRSLHEDQSGAIWVGTYDGGLSRIKDGRVANVTMDDGLFNNGVFRILEDARGNFWMSCNLGIYRVSRRQLDDFADGRIRAVNSIVYGKSDGMLNPECNGGYHPAGARARDGKLWFPTQQGVAVIDPETVPSNPHPPPVVIEECLLDRAAMDFGDQARIEPGQRNLEIHYTALSFIKPEHIRFKYKLEGLDGDWVDAETRRQAYYSYIPPGEYTFTVIAANSDGLWNTEGRSLRIVVLPPFYRTWWFIALASAGVVGLGVLLYRQRIAQLKRAHAAQEAFSRRLIESQEAERKRIAAELHDGLGQSLAIIRNRALFGLRANSGPDSIREQLERISEQSSQAIDEAKDISYNLRPYLLDRLGLAKALEAMAGKVAAASGVEISFESGEIDGVFSEEAEINLYRIVQESLNNIVKHAEAANAWVSVKRDGQTVTVTVGDDGKGFDIADCGLRIADSKAGGATQLANPQSAIRSPHSRGFGLAGIAERARMLGGDLMVHSAPGQGATIKLTLSLKEASR